jgi:carbon starvation protein CstA
MKDAENESHEGKKKHEVLWPIFQISHQRTLPISLLLLLLVLAPCSGFAWMDRL